VDKEKNNTMWDFWRNLKKTFFGKKTRTKKKQKNKIQTKYFFEIFFEIFEIL